MSAAIQGQALARRGGNVDGRGRIFGRPVRDRRDNGLNVTIRIAARGDDNRTRSILDAFRRSLRVFTAPQKTVADDQARLRNREAHSGSTPYSAASIAATTSSGRFPTTSRSEEHTSELQS